MLYHWEFPVPDICIILIIEGDIHLCSFLVGEGTTEGEGCGFGIGIFSYSQGSDT